MWLRRPLAFSGEGGRIQALLEEFNLHTVCQEARCPNRGECWTNRNVSFMILGEKCTRRCAFCAVTTARPSAVDTKEPERLAEAVAQLGLRYVVVTSVARDDLADEGADIFAACIRAIQERSPSTKVEVLTPDLHARRELIQRVVSSGPDVFSHNVETVERLSPSVRPQASYRRSLKVLRLAKELRSTTGMKTKSGLMVGLGEEPEEVRRTMVDLRQAGCEILTIGQYLQPTLHHRLVSSFIPLEQFEAYRLMGRELGFSFVASGPTVRSSYNAFEHLSGGS